MSFTQPPLILSRRLRAQGDPTRGIERGARRSEFVRVRPGAYLTADEWNALDDRGRHLVAMTAVSETSRRRLLFCGESAAALHGIPLLGGWNDRPHLVDHPDRRRAALVGVVTHRFDLADDEVIRVADFLATSPLRTAFDIAAARGILAGVVALDHVLGRAFGIDRVAASTHLERSRSRRGFRRIEAALAVATGLAESPLESLSLGQIHLMGYPKPRQQVEFDVDGRRYRADFHFEDADVIGEADGRTKYGPAVARVMSNDDLLWAEKEREDALRSVVRGFARWSWPHALHGDGLRARLQRAGVHPLR